MISDIKRAHMTSLAQHRDRLRAHPRLRCLFLELTDQCNLECLHCGSRCLRSQSTYLPFESAQKVLDDVAQRYDPRRIMLCITGGEPLLHPDFYRIMGYAASLGFPWGMTTNATLIDRDAAKRLREAGMRTVGVSMDGLKEQHDWLRNSPGAFDRAWRGIDALHAEGFRAQITTVIHKHNIDYLPAMYDLFRSRGIYSWRPVNIEPIGRARDNADLLLDPEGYRRLFAFIREKRFEANPPMEVTFACSHYLTLEHEHMLRDGYFLCGAGILIASISAGGDILACLDIERRPELVQGNISTDRFTDVWENRFEFFRRDRTADCDSCRSCPDRLFCGGDSTHTWDFDNNRPMLCMREILEGGNRHVQ